MKKVEEFQETQKLIDEYNGFESNVSELENKVELNNKRANIKIEKLEDQLKMTWEDVDFEIDRESLQSEINKQIENVKQDLEEENKNINKEIEESKDNKKYFRTDEHLKTITIEIEAMKKEVQKGKRELKKKDIELEEFYSEEKHENPLKWQEIYKEKDVIMQDINALTSKIEEYSKFKEDLLSIELTADEYKVMFEREEAKEQSTKTVGGEDKEENNSTEPKSEPKQATDKDTDKTQSNSNSGNKENSTEPKENEFNWDNFIKQYGGDRTNTTNTNPVSPQPTGSNEKENIVVPPVKPNKEDKIKQEMDSMWENYEKEQAEKIKREEALGYEEYAKQQRANEREEMPEERESRNKWKNGEELEDNHPVKKDSILKRMFNKIFKRTATYQMWKKDIQNSKAEDFEGAINTPYDIQKNISESSLITNRQKKKLNKLINSKYSLEIEQEKAKEDIQRKMKDMESEKDKRKNDVVWTDGVPNKDQLIAELNEEFDKKREERKNNNNEPTTKSWDYEFNKMLDEINSEIEMENNTHKTTTKSNDAEIDSILEEVKQRKEKPNTFKDELSNPEYTEKTNAVSKKHNQAPDLDTENIIQSQTVDMQAESEGPSMDD